MHTEPSKFKVSVSSSDFSGDTEELFVLCNWSEVTPLKKKKRQDIVHICT